MEDYSDLINSLIQEISVRTAQLKSRDTIILSKLNNELDKYVIMETVENYDKILKDYIFDRMSSSNIEIKKDRNKIIFSINIVEDEANFLQEFHTSLFQKLDIKRPQIK